MAGSTLVNEALVICAKAPCSKLMSPHSGPEGPKSSSSENSLTDGETTELLSATSDLASFVFKDLITEQLRIQQNIEKKKRELENLRNYSEMLEMPRGQSLRNAVFKQKDGEVAPFDYYLEHDHYKVRIHLDRTGFRTSNGSYMSLYFAIMRGEFDDSLDWPFTLQVTLKLVNQTGGKDIVKTINPDPSSNSFQKPVQETNPPISFPCFVSDAELGNFIKDGAIIIQCHTQC